jgi:hypothetical protein
MKTTKIRFLKSFAAAAAFSAFFNLGVKAQITIDANATPLNTHADQVGMWVNSNSDTNRQSYVDLMKDLNLKSIRHGWMYTVMDAITTDKFKMSPCDGSVQSYLSDGSCNLNETMKLSQVGQLAADLNVHGFAVLAMDGINYTGTSDATLTAMTKAQREQYYLDNAVRWANWAKNNNFKYFELGNENDLPGEMVDTGKGTEWTPQAYGAFAKRMAQAVKNVDPTIKCGINGGWRSTEALRKEWWDGILAGASDINNYIDFVVIHKYEFGSYYSTWSANLWDWGRIQSDNITAIKTNFPNKPIYITETSGYQSESGIVPHYRGVLTVEMMGNLFMDSQIEHIHNWGTSVMST